MSTISSPARVYSPSPSDLDKRSGVCYLSSRMRIEGASFVNPNTFAAMNFRALNVTPAVFQGLAEATARPVQDVHTRPMLEQYEGVSVKLSATVPVLRGQTASALAQLDVASGRIPPGEFRAATMEKSMGNLASTPVMKAAQGAEIDLLQTQGTMADVIARVRIAPLSNQQIKTNLMAALGAVPHG